jgi:multiple sugar transport system substrate-binding protein
MGFLPTEPGWFNWTWGYYFGGTLYDEAAGRITADDPRNVEALLWIKGYAERYGRDRLLQFRSGFGSFDSPQNAFIDGRVSMEIQGVWFSNYIRRHRPHLAFGVAPAPAAPGIPGPVGHVECDVIAIPRGCRHPDAAWRFVEFTQREGAAILCRLQGKHMPQREPPPGFYEGHPNLEVRTFAELAGSPHAFIQPRIRIWNEYQHELAKAFEHIWNWPVPEPPPGLAPDARRARADALCRERIAGVLAGIRAGMQERHDREAAVERQREARRTR